MPIHENWHLGAMHILETEVPRRTDPRIQISLESSKNCTVQSRVCKVFTRCPHCSPLEKLRSWLGKTVASTETTLLAHSVKQIWQVFHCNLVCLRPDTKRIQETNRGGTQFESSFSQVSLILATDMATHFDFLGKFRAESSRLLISKHIDHVRRGISEFLIRIEHKQQTNRYKQINSSGLHGQADRPFHLLSAR